MSNLNLQLDPDVFSTLREVAGKSKCSIKQVVEHSLRHSLAALAPEDFAEAVTRERGVHLTTAEQRTLGAFEALRQREYAPGVRYFTDEISRHIGALRWRTRLVLEGLQGRGLIASEPHDGQHIWWLVEHTPKRWSVDQGLRALASVRAYASSAHWHGVEGAWTERLLSERLGFSERVSGLRIPEYGEVRDMGPLYDEAKRLTEFAAGPD